MAFFKFFIITFSSFVGFALILKDTLIFEKQLFVETKRKNMNKNLKIVCSLKQLSLHFESFIISALIRDERNF